MNNFQKSKTFIVEGKAGYKVGDRVIALAGPMKGMEHEVIHVFDDGAVNIKPIQKGGMNRNSYRLGAAKAQPNQIKKA
jgi:hypothetical protein